MSAAGTSRTLALLAFAALAAQVAAPAAAQVPAGVQQACNADYRKLCTDVTPGGGRIIACMKAKDSELSDACRAALRDEESKSKTGSK